MEEHEMEDLKDRVMSRLKLQVPEGVECLVILSEKKDDPRVVFACLDDNNLPNMLAIAVMAAEHFALSSMDEVGEEPS